MSVTTGPASPTGTITLSDSSDSDVEVVAEFTLPKCSGINSSRHERANMVTGRDHVSFTTPTSDELLHKTRLIVINPGDLEAKQAFLKKWNEMSEDTEQQKIDKGWLKSIVPFSEQTCNRPVEHDVPQLSTDFIAEAVMDDEHVVLVNEMMCTALDAETARPISIAAFYITNDWEDREEEDGPVGQSLQDIAITYKWTYKAGETWVVDLGLICGHRDFRYAGRNMLERVKFYAISFIKKEDEHAAGFLFLADSTEESKGFYLRESFKETSSHFKLGEKTYRMVQKIDI